MYSRTLEALEDFIREAREDLSTYRDILEISDRIKKVEPKKEFFKPSHNAQVDVSDNREDSIALEKSPSVDTREKIIKSP